MWKNPGETGLDANGNDKATNGIDDDGNGVIDDVYGVNAVANNGDPMDDHYHRTHCAGNPVLITALAERCDLLLTLDKGDFGMLLGTEVYGMMILTPREFLVSQGLG